MNVLQFMLVYCMFLDEHVNHEPQFNLYFQHKLALQSRTSYVLKRCHFHFLLISVLFIVSAFEVCFIGGENSCLQRGCYFQSAKANDILFLTS